MNNRIGVCTVAFKEQSIDDIADLAAAAGADGLEIWGQPPHVAYPLDPDQCRLIRGAVTSRGLEICALGSYFRPGMNPSFAGVSPDADNQVKLAELLGTRVIRVWAGSGNYDDTSQDDRASICKSIASFADVALKSGMSVVLERHNSSLTNSWISPATVLEMIGRRNVYLNYQVPHPIPPAELAAGAIEDYRRYLRVSAHSHLQNYRGTPGDPQNPVRCFLDEGAADYSQIGHAVAASGYEGYFMVEFLPDDLQGLSTIEALKRDIDYLRSCLC